MEAIVKLSHQIRAVAKSILVSFLMIAVSGTTIVIHHDHPIAPVGAENADHTDDESANGHQSTKGATYHEIHLLKLVTGDRFNTTPPFQSPTSFAPFLVFHDTSSSSCSIPRFSASTISNGHTARMASRERCTLFCTLLV